VLLTGYPHDLVALVRHPVAEDADLVRLLLEHGANPNAATEFGDTLLHLAATKGHFETMRLLLLHGANPNAKSIEGLTPLMVAHDVHCRRLLVESGANVNARDNGGSAVLTWAITPEEVEYLLQHGADVNSVNASGETALIKAVRDAQDYDPAQAKITAHKLLIVRSLVAHGADIQARDNKGFTALDYSRRCFNPLAGQIALAIESKH